MVSKIAVIALVAIVAAPILLGYGLNFEDIQKIRYDPDGNVTNVTELIQNGTEYSYVSADPMLLNSDNIKLDRDLSNTLPHRYTPDWGLPAAYTRYTSTYSSQYYRTYDTSGDPPIFDPINCSMLYFYVDYKNLPVIVSTGGVSVQFYDADFNPTVLINGVYYIWYYGDAIKYSYKSSGNIINTSLANTDGNLSYFSVTRGTDFVGNLHYVWRYTSDTPSVISAGSFYADIYSGFHVFAPLAKNPFGSSGTNADLQIPSIATSGAAKSILLTLDLDSVTQPTFNQIITPQSVLTSSLTALQAERVILSKNTDGSGVHWYLQKFEQNVATPSYSEEILYNPAGSNVYQLQLSKDSADLFYVGAWPDKIGPANYYRTWQVPLTLTDDIYKTGIVAIDANSTYQDSMRMRVDSALIRSDEYKVITNQTYDPAQLKANPETTLNKINLYGSSLEFGGYTFNVTDDYITLQGHKIKLNGMVFRSEPNESGGYDNTINGTLISNTPTPSTLTFNDSWSASISTDSMSANYVIDNKWMPGKFAWQGVDDSFKMAGLLTSLAIFILLGMYGRRSGTKVLPLMLVCAGAGFMFLLMF